MNLHLNMMVERERRRDELVMIQQEQLLRSSGIKSYPWTHRQLAALGDKLVTFGTWLQRRYADLAIPTTAEMFSTEQEGTCI